MALLQASCGLPQTERCLAGARRFWAAMEPTKNDAAESVRIIAARRDCFDFVIGVLGGSRRCQYRARQQMVLTLFRWRKGWDSNPRCGSPHTAFPVLPVKPLLHLSEIGDFQLPIAN